VRYIPSPTFEVVWDISLGGGYTLAGGGKDAFFIAPGGDVEWIYETNETIEHVAMSEDGRYLAVSHKVFSKVVCEGTIDFLDREKGQKGENTTPISTKSSQSEAVSAAPRSGNGEGGGVITGVLVLILAALIGIAWKEMRE